MEEQPPLFAAPYNLSTFQRDLTPYLGIAELGQFGVRRAMKTQLSVKFKPLLATGCF
ncbi:hypothetical protein PIB30_026172 [Stylosanthes scabra]|uniref:Uncharacterized protein n=1 Tax=Stylosanthes scabra TaxID=79078 RepID=A0ABU6WDD5_9FABA|nr:hypothetical protein [Stylosanthes scabra]